MGAETELPGYVSEPVDPPFKLISQALIRQATAAGVRYMTVNGIDCKLALDEAFAADGLLPLLVTLVQHRHGLASLPLYLLPDKANALTGWRVALGEQVTDEQIKSALALLGEELTLLIDASTSKEFISLDSHEWRGLPFG